MGALQPIELGDDIGADSDAASPPAIGSLTTWRTFAEAEAAWRDFESKAVATPYHRFDWLEAWHRHVGSRLGLEPLIAMARDGEGRPIFLWPLGVGRSGPARIGGWLGGKLVNYKMGLYAPGGDAALDRAALRFATRALREAAGLDALYLTNQPVAWRDLRNPLVAMDHQPSPSFAYSLALRPDFDSLYAELRSGSTRKKLRRSERRMVEIYGSCDLRRPASADEVDRVLDTFFVQKTRRMQEKNLRNVFAQPGVMDFFRETAVRSIGTEEPLLDLFWLDAGGQVAATWAGTAAGGRLSGIINSFDQETFGEHQPGEILLRQVIEHACRRGLTDFDLGVGEAQYKDSWCPRTDELFDSFLPLSPLGFVHTTVAKAGFRLKRVAKQSEFLSDLAARLR